VNFSKDLMRQSTEPLAGRISYIDLTPFLLKEIGGVSSWSDLWLRGGFSANFRQGCGENC
jgi:predicted AAA+ superfamily ATPase